MSRKREKQRQDAKEMHRQLGADPEIDPDTLRARPRVTRPEWDASLIVHAMKRGLFQRARPFELHVAMFVVDGGGIRLGRVESSIAPAAKAGALALEAAPARGPDPLRYTRPAHFIMIALAAERVADGPALDLGEPTIHVVIDGADVALDDKRVRLHESPTAMQLAGLRPGELVFAAGTLLSIAAVRDVRSTVVLPLEDRGFRADLHLALRL